MEKLGISWPILHLLFILWFSCTLARNLEFPRYETAYACESKLLKIECKEGEVIRLIRANYGRFSITICNDHGITDWSVNCMSPKSLRVLHNRCSQNQNCSILASTTTFGDPCAGTHKYLEAHYQCILTSTTTTTYRSTPPWLITTQIPTVWSTIKPTVRPPPPPPRVSPAAVTTSTPIKTSQGSVLTSPQQSANKLPQAVPVVPSEPEDDSDVVETSNNKETLDKTELLSPNTPQEDVSSTPNTTTYFRKFPEDSTNNYKYVPSPSVPWSQQNDNSIHFCSPATARNLYWNWTRVQERTVQPCPGGATGLARWKCLQSSDSSEPYWYPNTPDLSECRSVWLTSLESRVIEGDSLIAITSDLSQVTSSKTLYGGDMMITTKIIKKMAQKMSEDIQTFPDQRQREAIVTELLHGVVRTGSNLLDSSQHPSWRDLSYKEQMRVATSLLIGLEENAFLLADTVIREKTVVQTVKNIMLSVRVLETKNIKTETFPSEASTDKWSASNDWLQLSRDALLENSEGGLVRLVFVAFDRLEEILQWKPEAAIESDQPKNLSRMLNSKVISASLGKGRHIQLSQPVKLFLRHLKTENVSNPSCVFWDYTMSTWSEEGCHVESTNLTHTTCLCDHLTNFAILMDVHSTYLPPVHQMALQIITYIGCIISIGCLILTIITFQTFRGLKSDRTTIHKNLCFCLLVAEMLFVIGIGRTNERILCGVVAGLLHLFFLCAFAWMFLEGFQLYVMLIEVFEAEKSRIRWYYLVGYGIPPFIVAISAIIDPFSYGTDQYCWLRADNFFIFSFVGPVILILVANIVFLVMAIVMMCKHGNASITIKSKEHSRLASVRTWLRGAFMLVFLLGLTWTFGLLYLNKESVVMAYIFTTLNSMQGLFIFMFHCIQNEKVRKEYRKFVRRHSWLPNCLRCSKPSTSTSSGSGIDKERRTSLYGGGGASGGVATNSNNTTTSGCGQTTIDNSVSSSSNTQHHHGTNQQQYIMQKAWSSHSCTTMNRIGKSSPSNHVGTTSRIITPPMNFTPQSSQQLQQQQSPQPVSVDDTHTGITMTTQSPTPSAPPLSQQVPLVYDDDIIPISAINTATLPYFRNFYKSNNLIGGVAANTSNNGGTPNNSISHSSNFPKSVSTWGPLHKPLHWKNISFKSYSRDSGHGGSEQEESPKSNVLESNHTNSCDFRQNPIVKENLNHRQQQQQQQQQYISPELNAQFPFTNDLSPQQTQLTEYLYKTNNHHPVNNGCKASPPQSSGQMLIGSNSLQHPTNSRKKTHGSCFLRSTSPWNHTYTEILDGQMQQQLQHQHHLDDPVYEEIGRTNEIQVSDLSDAEDKRQCGDNISRHSSRSYGDHRPLIPYNSNIDRNIHHLDSAGSGLMIGTSKTHRSKNDHDLDQYRRQNMYRGENARSLAAVLDGETVICHLEPPELYPTHHNPYNLRTIVLPPYSES